MEIQPEASEQPVSPAPERGVRWVFWGKDGLRAGWSALLFLVILAALATLTLFLAHFFVHPNRNVKGPMGPKPGLIQEGLQLALILIATAIMAAIERRPMGMYGYSGRARLTRFCWGLVWGFVAISALVGTLWKFHWLVFDGQPMHGAIAWEYAAAWGAVFLLVGLAEESLLRGYLHGHNPGESPVGLFSAGAVGLVFCLSLWYTRSLWWGIGFHAAWDWGQSYFYGTSDSGMVARGHLLSEHPAGPLLWSGGPTGPEGSLLIVPLLIIMALAMWVWWGAGRTGWRCEQEMARPEGFEPPTY